MLQKLTINNFKKHACLELDFSEGTNLILGKNWAGKSTCLWAVVYALFGPSAIPGGSKLVPTLNKTSKPSVELTMRLNEHTYEVARSPDRAEVKKDGTSVAYGAAAVSAYIEALLGLSAQDFTMLRFAKQNEAAAILTLGVAKLTQIINQVTRVDVVERVVAKAAFNATILSKELEGLPDVDLKELGDKHRQSAETLDKLRGELANSRALLSEAYINGENKKTELEAAQKEMQTYQASLQASEAAIARTNQLQGQIELLREDANRPLMESPEPLVVLLTKQQKLTDELDVLRDSLASFYAEESSLRQTIASQSKVYDLDVLAQERETVHQNIVALSSDKAIAAQRVSQLEQAVRSAVCSMCNRPFENHDPEVLRQELGECKVEVVSIANKLAAANKEYSDISTRYAAAEEIATRLNRASWMVGTTTDSLARVQGDLAGIEQALTSWPRITLEEAARRVASANQHNRKVEEAARRLPALEAELSRVKCSVSLLVLPDPDRVTQAASRWNEAMTTYHKLMETTAEIEREETKVSQEHTGLAAQLRRAQEISTRKAAVEQAISNHKRLLKYLRDNRDKFSARIWEAILSRCSAFVSSATRGQIVEISRTSDGEFQYLEEGVWMPVGAASGVQQAVLGVGVRLALVEALRAPGAFLLLDEVTAGSHDDLSLDIVRAIGEAQDQVVVVSHRQADAAAANHVIELM